MQDHKLREIPELMHKLLAVAKRTIAKGDGDNEGGYLYLLDVANSGTPLLYTRFGQVREADKPRYRAFASEKARRLLCHPDHRTSWESRDEPAYQYGGAIRACGHIFSFSGLPECWDEALMLALAIRLGFLPTDPAYAREMASPQTQLLLPALVGA